MSKSFLIPSSAAARAAVVGFLLFACAVASLSAHSASVNSTHEETLFESNWTHGLDSRLQLQRASTDAIRILPMSGMRSGKSLRFSISRNADYSAVANGTPRAEISFNGFLHFARGREYAIEWEMRIPEDYQFDSKQDEVIGQIHQGQASGYPPFALFISGNGQYEVHSRTERKQDYVSSLFGTPLLDRGRIVNWKLLYLPDPSGNLSKTELYKDGRKVFSLSGVPNAYANDDRAYLKLGIYKAHWQRQPSDVENRTLDFGPVSVSVRSVTRDAFDSAGANTSRSMQDITQQEVKR